MYEGLEKARKSTDSFLSIQQQQSNVVSDYMPAKSKFDWDSFGHHNEIESAKSEGGWADEFGSQNESAPLQAKGFNERISAGKPFDPYSGKKLNVPDTMAANIKNSFGVDPGKVSMLESSEVSKIGAKATTQGNVIRFAPGEFKPDTKEGQKLLGHELNHVREQAQGKIKANVEGTNVHYDPSHEASSDRAGEAFAGGTMNEAAPVSVGSGASAGGAAVQGLFRTVGAVSRVMGNLMPKIGPQREKPEDDPWEVATGLSDASTDMQAAEIVFNNHVYDRDTVTPQKEPKPPAKSRLGNKIRGNGSEKPAKGVRGLLNKARKGIANKVDSTVERAGNFKKKVGNIKEKVMNPRETLKGVKDSFSDKKRGKTLKKIRKGISKKVDSKFSASGMLGLASKGMYAKGIVNRIRNREFGEAVEDTGDFVGNKVGNSKGYKLGSAATKAGLGVLGKTKKGAKIGAKIGSIIPGKGTVIGAAIGGIAGAVIGSGVGKAAGRAIGRGVNAIGGGIRDGVNAVRNNVEERGGIRAVGRQALQGAAGGALAGGAIGGKKGAVIGGVAGGIRGLLGGGRRNNNE